MGHIYNNHYFLNFPITSVNIFSSYGFSIPLALAMLVWCHMSKRPAKTPASTSASK